MSVEQNKAVVRRWLTEVVTGGKPEAFDEVLGENYTRYNDSDGAWAPGMRGLEQAKTWYGGFLGEYPGWRVSVEDLVAEGDSVAVRMVGRDGDKPLYNCIALYRLADGRIVEDWVCMTQLET